MTTAFLQSFYAAMWFETGGLFDPKDPGCINGTDRRKCGTSGGPDDRGGDTKFGLAQKFHPELNVESLTMWQAAEVYWRKYWNSLRCGDLVIPVGQYLFDTSCGNFVEAPRILQRVVGANVDGAVGPKTIAAAQRYAAPWIVEQMRQGRHALYEHIAGQDPTQAKFVDGWKDRADHFLSRVATYSGVTVPAVTAGADDGF